MRAVRLVVTVLAILAPTVAFAADWPYFRGPKANGASPEVGINKNWKQKPPKMLWSTAMTDDGYAGPSVAGGKVFIIDHQGAEDVVRAIDVNTGKNVWTYRYADDAKANYGYSRATPVVDGGKVYALGRMGLLNCLDAKTGKKVWAKDIQAEFRGKRPTWNYAMSPLVDGKQVVVCPGGENAAVVALDKTTGKTLWKGGGSDIPGYSTPVLARIDGKRQYLVFTGVSIVGVDASNGKLLWRHPWKTQYDINAAAPYPIGDSVFIASGYKHGCALVGIKGNAVTPKWENAEMMARFSSPVLTGGYLYGVGEPGDLVCLDPQTGTAKWRQPGFEFGGMVLVDGVILVADGKSGDLVMVKPSPGSYQELGRFAPLGGQSWTAPIISNGRLIVRNKTTLACFSLK